mmetsp:Transcript_32319/g.106680  ORF Transcript_32319/g.106680 Transcript_32319/m.106680 type:complete len:207 (-) Transcript_32319:1318-1938(-)
MSRKGCTPPSAGGSACRRGISGSSEASREAVAGRASWRWILPVSGSIQKTWCPPAAGTISSSSEMGAELEGSSRIVGPQSAIASQAWPEAPKYFCQTISEVVASRAKSFKEAVMTRTSLSAPKSRNSSQLVGARAPGASFISLRLRARLGVTQAVKAATSAVGSCTNSARRAGSPVSCAARAARPCEASWGSLFWRSASVAAVERL